MPTLMQKGVTWFTQQMLDAAGRSVVFVRGDTEHTLIAWVTESVYTVVDAGVPVEISTRDFKFRTADLPLTPQQGDRFRETINGETHEVEVMALSDQPAHSWVDSDGTITVARCKTVFVR